MKNEIKNEATNIIAKCHDSEVVELQNQNVNKFWENETKWNMEWIYFKQEDFTIHFLIAAIKTIVWSPQLSQCVTMTMVKSHTYFKCKVLT